MLLREVEYARPSTIEEALTLLSEHDGARALAGGQTLVNVMKARAASPDVLVDLADLAELRTISFSADESMLEIGAMVTNTQMIALLRGRGRAPDPRRDRRDDRRRPDPQPRHDRRQRLRQRPDEPLSAAAHRARRHVHDPGRRRHPHDRRAEEFLLGVYLTAVGQGELLTRISVPDTLPGSGDAMEGVALGAHGTYIVNAAATVGPAGVSVVIGCVSSAPVRATVMEERLAAGDLSEGAVRAAAAGLGASLDPPSDVHASADYRSHLAEVSAVRAVLKAAQRAKG